MSRPQAQNFLSHGCTRMLEPKPTSEALSGPQGSSTGTKFCKLHPEQAHAGCLSHMCEIYLQLQGQQQLSVAGKPANLPNLESITPLTKQWLVRLLWVPTMSPHVTGGIYAYTLSFLSSVAAAGSHLPWPFCHLMGPTTWRTCFLLLRCSYIIPSGGPCNQSAGSAEYLQ